MEIDHPDLEVRMEAWDILRSFGAGVGRDVGERAARAFLKAAPDDRERAKAAARDAAAFANHHFYRNYARRDGDMSAWFAMAERGLHDIAAEGAEIVRAADAARGATIDDEEAERAECAAEEEDERVEKLEADGWYGRTHLYVPDCEAWIYVRFGRPPNAGRSVFGLAGEDTEDGPDEWRVAMGNMTHEAGVCVFRAVRHPAVPDAYVLLQPDFDNALYGVSGGFARYLDNVVPRFEEGEPPTVQRLDGSPVTCVGRDGTRRIDLGSDGEYMVDMAKPCVVHDLALTDVWASETVRMDEFLKATRGYEWPGEQLRGPGP